MDVAIGRQDLVPGGGTPNGEVPVDAAPYVAPDPGLFHQLVDAYAPQLLISATIVAVSIVVVAGVFGIYLSNRILTRRGRRTESGANQADDTLAVSRRKATNAAYVLFLIGSLVSLTSTIQSLRHEMGSNPLLWFLVISLGVIFEMAMIVFFNLARVNIIEAGKGGIEAAAPWGLAAVVGAVTYYEVKAGTDNAGWAFARLAVPVLVAFVVSRILAYARRQYLRDHPKPEGDEAEAQDAPGNPLKILWTRALIWAGLVDDKGFKGSTLVRRRRVMRVARDRFEGEGTSAPAGRWAKFWYERRIRKARRREFRLLIRYGQEVTADVSTYLAIIHQADEQLKKDVVLKHNVWGAVLPAAQASVGSQATSTGTAPTARSASTSTDREAVLMGAGGGSSTAPNTEPPAVSDTTSTGTGDAKSGPSESSRGGNRVVPMTLAEVAELRASWSSADLVARKQDVGAAEAYAGKVGREVVAAGGKATHGMRAYALVMFAAEHFDFNATTMFTLVTRKKSDPGCAGGKQKRLYRQQLGLHKDVYDRFLEELNAAPKAPSSDASTGGAQ